MPISTLCLPLIYICNRQIMGEELQELDLQKLNQLDNLVASALRRVTDTKVINCSLICVIPIYISINQLASFNLIW